MYHQLAVHSNTEMAGEVENRVQVRNNINYELEQFVEKILSKKERTDYFIFLSILLFLHKKEQFIVNIFNRPDIFQVRKLENKNIKTYYRLLFLQPLNPELTGLLLEQKSKLEERDLFSYY